MSNEIIGLLLRLFATKNRLSAGKLNVLLHLYLLCKKQPLSLHHLYKKIAELVGVAQLQLYIVLQFVFSVFISKLNLACSPYRLLIVC